MRFLNHIKTPQTLTLIFDQGDPVSIRCEDPLYSQIENLVEANRLNDIPALISRVPAKTAGKFMLQDGRIVLDGRVLPRTLSERLIQLVQRGIDTAPLERFWDNCKANPQTESVDEMFDFLSRNHCPITADGCFIAYKSVNDDWKDVHSKTYVNKPGSTITMNRDKVDPDRRNQCSYGFHVGGFEYASTFGGQRLLEVKVNPRDVVAVPLDSNAGKMRVCKYEVIRENPRTERRELTYSGNRSSKEKRLVTPQSPTGTVIPPKSKSGIRRLPKILKYAETDQTGGISLSFEVLGRLFTFGQKVYASVANARTRSITIAGSRPKGKVQFVKELTVGEATRIYSGMFATAQIDGKPRYTLAITKGVLVIN